MSGLEAFGLAIQFGATVAAALFGVVGAFSRRENGMLKASDKVVVVGVIASAVFALTALTIEAVRKERARAAETVRVSEELARQSNLLQQVQRGLYAIADYSVGVQYTVSTDRPSLGSLVGRWMPIWRRPP